MSHYKIIAVISGIVLVLVGFFLFKGGDGEKSFGGEKNSESGQSQSAPSSAPESASELASESSSDRQIFTHPKYLFKFEYPKDFNATSFEDGEGDIVLVQSKDSKRGFQMYIAPFDEEGPITPERVKKDLPNIVIEDPKPVILGGRTSDKLLKSDFRSLGGIQALIFFSKDESLGHTREVWFVWPEDPKLAGNYLYQVTAPAGFDEELSKIMATLTFSE